MRNLVLLVLILAFLLMALALEREPVGEVPEDLPPPLRPGVAAVSFERLAAFTYGDTVPRTTGHIPEAVRRLDGTKVRLRGHMIAVEKGSDGRVTSFALSRTSPDCCFGRQPRINEWVLVHTDGSLPIPTVDRRQKLWVSGTLTVGEVQRDGVVVAIYELAAEAVE